MHVDLRAILLILALVCFVLAATGVATWKWDRFVPAGLAFATLAMLVQ